MSICFYNDGLLDLRFITLFGASKKVGNSPIGYFGTGLKYAIAVLLREGQKVSLYRGGDIHVFGTVNENIRGAQFRTVTMDDQPIGFTTELGKNWKTWMAFRELYANAIDEGGSVREKQTPKPRQGMTIIVVDGQKIEEQFAQRDTIILPRKTPLERGKNLDRYSGASHHTYYRGVRICKAKHSLYTWSIRSGCELTEDRTFKYSWEASNQVARHILGSHDKNLIQQCITAEISIYEGALDYDCYHPEGPSAEFLEVAQEVASHGKPLSTSAKHVAEKAIGIMAPDASEQLSPVEQKKLDRAKTIIRRIGAEPDDFPIKVAKSLGPGCYGRAHDGTIWLSIFAFEQGTKMVASTLYEEWVHLQFGYEDESRGMQNFLFEKLFTLAEEHILGEPI